MQRKISFLLFGLYLIIIAYSKSYAFTLHSSALTSNGQIPSLYTCDGKNLSPEIDWTGVPEKTQSFVLLLTDPNAPTQPFYHWALYNIPKDILSIPEGAAKLPQNVMVGKNSWHQQNYRGPCPPKSKKHTYVFTLYALDADLKLAKGSEANLIYNLLQKHLIQKIELSATYKRP